MQVKAIRTKKIRIGDDLHQILDEHLPEKLGEKSVIAITSKIVAICERNVEKIINQEQKDELIAKESEYYLPRSMNQYDFMTTIKNGILGAAAGLDESNGNGYYILLPKNPQKSANSIREYLQKKYNVKNLGILITDSKIDPLRKGVTGVSIAHSGFMAIKDYVGKPDVFGREIQLGRSNIAEALSATAVLEMGEGSEQQPIVVITDVNYVVFQDRNPTKDEIDFLKVKKEDDFFSPILTSVEWKKGGS